MTDKILKEAITLQDEIRGVECRLDYMYQIRDRFSGNECYSASAMLFDKAGNTIMVKDSICGFREFKVEIDPQYVMNVLQEKITGLERQREVLTLKFSKL